MIIQRSFFSRFSPAIKEAVPQNDDRQLVVPSRFSLVGLPPEPLHLTGAGNNEQNSSFARTLNFSVTNAAASVDTPCRLSPGYWHIYILGSYSSNYASALVAGPDFAIAFVEAASNVTLVSRFAQLVGCQPFHDEFDIMISNPAVLNSTNSFTATLAANGVGQTHSLSYTLVCNRLL
jgi:hypothetical protein